MGVEEAVRMEWVLEMAMGMSWREELKMARMIVPAEGEAGKGGSVAERRCEQESGKREALQAWMISEEGEEVVVRRKKKKERERIREVIWEDVAVEEVGVGLIGFEGRDCNKVLDLDGDGMNVILLILQC